jgi:hypothetical protein
LTVAAASQALLFLVSGEGQRGQDAEQRQTNQHFGQGPATAVGRWTAKCLREKAQFLGLGVEPLHGVASAWWDLIVAFCIHLVQFQATPLRTICQNMPLKHAATNA